MLSFFGSAEWLDSSFANFLPPELFPVARL